MKAQIVPTRLVLAAVLLVVLPGLRPARPALSPALPMQTDLTPGALDAGFDPGMGANGPIYAVALQPDGKMLIGGNFDQVNGVFRNCIARLNTDGSLDLGFDPGTGANLTVHAVAVQPDGKVLIGGQFTQVDGQPRNHIARLHYDGILDTGFDTSTGTNGTVWAVAVQPDGKVLIGGNFTKVNGVGTNSIARLNADGTRDTDYYDLGANGTVFAVVVQPDGHVLIGGAFTMVNGVGRNHIARLWQYGDLEDYFNPGTGASADVHAVALQADGKVLIGGDFTTVNGVGRNRIARLNANGALDTSFDPGTGANDYVEAVALQTDGKVLIGGYFTQVNGVGRSRIARLYADGSLDASFDTSTGANWVVYAVVLQSDGHALIGGDFTTVNGVARNRIARLNTDGSLDTSFDTSVGADGVVYAVALQPDGKVLIGGAFTHVNGVGRNFIARLNANGSLDMSFDPGTGPDSVVFAVAVQTDGKVLIGGAFTLVDGIGEGHIGRLNANGSRDAGYNPQADGTVEAVVVQPDGKVLIGGDFNYIGFMGERHKIARLWPNGTMDAGFDPHIGADDTVQAIALQSDGKVLIGGRFTHFYGVGRNHIARLYDEGMLDYGFDPGTGASDTVYAVALQADGKVLIGGDFIMVNGVEHSFVARLNANGSLDTDFYSYPGLEGPVFAIAVQPCGKVLIGGSFTMVDEAERNRIARLQADGSLDAGFDPGTGADSTVYAMALQPDSKVLIGGSFTQVNGQPRNHIARLNAAIPPIFTSRMLLPGHVGKLYTYTFTACGLPPPPFYVTSGSLPPGLTLDAISGLLTGRPMVAGTYQFTVTASNYVGSANKFITLMIYSEAYLPLILRQ